MTRSVYPRLTAAERAHFTQVQAYEDAIAYRSSRLAAPCSRCGPAQCGPTQCASTQCASAKCASTQCGPTRCCPTRCEEHASDADLIATYRQAIAALGRLT